MNNILEFYVKMKDMMSGGLAKLSQNAQKYNSQIQDGINKTINKNKELADSFDKVSNKASSSGSSIGKWVKGLALAGAAVGVLTAGLGFAKDSVGKAMEFGKTKESFKVLTGSDKKGEGLANDLNQLQQKTILGPEVFKAAQTMLGFGIASEKVLPLMKTMGDISMGDADKLQSLTLAFSQMSAAGKLQGQDLLQMINAGFNPLNEISKKTGVSIGDLKKQMEKGAISAQMVEAAFMSATSSGGQFDGMMNKLAETPAGKMAQLQGQWENFQVNLGNALMPLATTLMDLAQPLLDMASTYLPMISEGVNYILSIFQGINGESNNWSFYMQTIGEMIGIVWSGMIYVWKILWNIIGGVIQWIGKSEIIKDIFIGIKWILGQVYEAIKVIADGIKWIWDNILKPVLDGIETAYRLVKKIFGGGKAEVKVSQDGTLTASLPQSANTSSLTATQVTSGKDNSLASMMKAGTKGSGDGVAKDVAGGGQRVINITIGKMVESIVMHVNGVQDGLNNMEQRVEEALLRVLNSGATVQ
jgi:tape measure domain-containing protein